jgi:YHS domain-containing protein
MDIAPGSAAGTSKYEGRTYYFCAMGCKRDFDEDPVGILKAEAQYDHSAPVDHGMSGMTRGVKKSWWKFWR